MKLVCQISFRFMGCVASLAMFLATPQLTCAQIYSSNVYGYLPYVFYPGANLFANPLQSTDNTLNGLFSNQSLPNGTTVSLWNPTTSGFDTTSVFSAGSWSVNLTLQPGTGAELVVPSKFTNTFQGIVLNPDGSIYESGNFIQPPVFLGPNGTYLLADACPLTDTGTDIFLNILGRMPNPGEQVTILDSVSQTYTTYTYLGNGLWNNVPTLNPGEAAFFNVNSVPEPSALGLFVLAGLLLTWRRWKTGRSKTLTSFHILTPEDRVWRVF